MDNAGMSNWIYYDSFAQEYVLEKEVTAPPERYIPTCKYKGENGVYIENWKDADGRCLSIAYSSDEYYTPMHDAKYEYVCKQNAFHPQRLKSFVIPEEKFDQYINEIYAQMDDDRIKEIISDMEEQIRDCERGYDDSGEAVFDPTAVILNIDQAKTILKELKKEI